MMNLWIALLVEKTEYTCCIEYHGPIDGAVHHDYGRSKPVSKC